MTKIASHTPRGTTHRIEYGRVEDFGIERDGELKWMASCDDHGTFVMTETKAQARSSSGLDFCQDCRDERP